LNRAINKILLVSLIPLILSIGISPALPHNVLPEANAFKSKGNSLTETGSKKVCGDRLCSEIKYKDSKPQNPKNVSSPLGQFKVGTPLNLIQCKSGYELVLKVVNSQPACVKPESVQRLISINWAMDKVEQNKVLSSLPPKSEDVTTSKVGSTQNPILNITPDYIDGQRQLIFEGFGWKGFHTVTIHITNNQDYFYKLKTKTTQSGELFMPWFVPQDLNSGIYHFNAFVGDQSFEIDIPITQ